MNIDKLYSRALAQYDAKKFDAALKSLDRLKKIAPNYKKIYYLEAAVCHEQKNPVREYYALKKLSSLLNLDAAGEKNFKSDVFNKLGEVCLILSLKEEGFKSYYLAATFAPDKKTFLYYVDSMIFVANTSENFSAEDFRALYDEYKKHFPKIPPPIESIPCS